MARIAPTKAADGPAAAAPIVLVDKSVPTVVAKCVSTEKVAQLSAAAFWAFATSLDPQAARTHFIASILIASCIGFGQMHCKFKSQLTLAMASFKQGTCGMC
jgi:hypothetical protein